MMATHQLCAATGQSLYIYYKTDEVGQSPDRAYFLLASGQKSVHPQSSYVAGTDMTCQAIPPDGMRVKDWLTATGAILPPTAAAKSTGESDESFVWTCTDDAYATILAAFDYIK